MLNSNSPPQSPQDAIRQHATVTPREMRRMRRWMGTRFEPRKDGKINKPPYRVRHGERVVKADKTSPANWATFREALLALEDGAVDAIGFVFTDSDPFFVVDADHVIDLETGEIHPAALRIIHALDTYTERSCSGTGLHAIGVGSKPKNARCKSNALGFSLELYDGASGARFMVMTGKPFGVTSNAPKRDECEDRSQILEELCKELWPPKPPPPKPPRSEPRPPGSRPIDLDDEALLDKARRARSGPKFYRLYDKGDTSGYPSHSEADMGLINMLIFWTGADEERIIRLFEGSALYRDAPDKHAGYLQTTVKVALATYTGSLYEVQPIKKRHKAPEPSPQREDDPLEPYLRLLLSPAAWRGKRGASAYKAYAALISRAAHHGIVSGDGNLRIGVDLRTLAEHAGTSIATLSRSALPYLLQEMKLIRWRRGKGKDAGEFVLLNPENAQLITLITTHFSVITQHNPESVIDTLRLLIRMRGGRSKRAKLARLGMVAMFSLIALAPAGQSPSAARGYSVEELADILGRRKPDVRRILERLQDANLVEPMMDRFVLSDAFRKEYERELRQSGIVASERFQRYRHEKDRREREKDRQRRKQDPNYRAADPTPDLFGPEKTKRIVAERAREAYEHRVKEEETKVGMTAAVFLSAKVTSGHRWEELRAAWNGMGGRTESLRHAVLEGPFFFKREDSDRLLLYVYRDRSEAV